MAATNLLNADLTTVGRELGRGFAWWGDELRAMIPAAARRALAGAPTTVAELSADGARHTLFRGTRAVAGEGGRAGVALARGRVLERTLALPPLSRRDTRALVALDLDRLTPFAADEVVFDLAFLETPPGAATRAVLLGVLPRAEAAAAIAAARAGGIEPTALGHSLAPGSGEMRFDFLPQLAEGTRPWWARPRFWWGLVLALLVANLALAIWRDIRATDALAEAVAAQADGVLLARRLSARVAAEDARRAALVARRAEREPARLIAAATRALPPPAWVQRFAWDGVTLRLTGFARGVDAAAALRRAPGLGAVRVVGGDLPGEAAAGQPFDISIEPAR